MNSSFNKPNLTFPKNAFEFHQQFSTDEACREYLVQMRWKNGIPIHPDTGEEPRYYLANRQVWKFKDGYQMSATAGTIMHRSKIPLTKWFYAAYLVATHVPGTSALQLSRQIGLRFETTFMMLHKLRTGLVDPDRRQLSGTVEVDETFIGGKAAGEPGRAAGNKTIVAGAVELRRYTDKHGEEQIAAGRVRLQVIANAKEHQLMGFLKEHVENESEIITDGWLGYKNTNEYGYQHTTIRGLNSVHVAKQMGHIHRVFSNLKTWILGTHHGVSAKHMQAYLDEFTFRFNRRSVPFRAFASVLGISTQVEGPEYDEVYGGREGG